MSLRYKIPGDSRWHFDNAKAQELQRSVPNYWEDTCPTCGNKENLTGCRCLENHRTCPNCKTTWHWKLNIDAAKMEVVID